MGVLLAILIGCVLLFAVTYWSPDAVTRRKLQKAQLHRIAELPENTLGRIVGAARPVDKILTAPLSGRECVMYLIKVEEEHSTGKSRSWKTLIRESDCTRFMLEDGSGRALVEPSGAELSLVFDNKSRSGTFDNPTESEAAFLARHNKSGQSFLGLNRTLRYSEAILGIGERVAILGQGVREPDPEAPPTDAYRGEPPTRLRLTSSAAYPLVISDAPETTH